MAYHWEARFRQRQVDKANAARDRLAQQEAAREAERTEMAAKEALCRQEKEAARRKALEEQIRTRDKTGMKKTYNEREKQLQRLLQERSWHNGVINQMQKEEQQQLRTDALRDHNSKSKVLRDHGLYRGDASFFLDSEYS
jgi:chromosome segregation ATPase